MNLLPKMFKNEKVDVQVDEKVIIQEIHDSFDNAQDELLKEAMSIIEQDDPFLSNKANRLEQLGFVSSKTVLEYRTQKKVLVSSINDADLVNHYKTEYPFLKFLKEDQLDSICKKYNLIYAPVSKYKEDVPEKNVLEIENAQALIRIDELKKVRKITKISFWPDNTTEYKEFVINLIKTEEFESYEIELTEDSMRKAIQKSNFKGEIGGDYYFLKATIETIDKTGLFIAAPKSHFDLIELENKELGFFNITITEVKDPIVFRYVKGGIQVLTKWGLEASDEMLQQPIMN